MPEFLKYREAPAQPYVLEYSASFKDSKNEMTRKSLFYAVPQLYANVANDFINAKICKPSELVYITRGPSVNTFSCSSDPN